MQQRGGGGIRAGGAAVEAEVMERGARIHAASGALLHLAIRLEKAPPNALVISVAIDQMAEFRDQVSWLLTDCIMRRFVVVPQ